MTIFSPPARGTKPVELQILAQRLQTWRASRRRGQRIPAELWAAASDLARIHGLNSTAAALKLNYNALRHRLSAAGVSLSPPRPRGGPRVPTFVELISGPMSSGGRGEPGCVELVQVSGARLILRLPGASAKELLPVVQLFLHQRP